MVKNSPAPQKSTASAITGYLLVTVSVIVLVLAGMNLVSKNQKLATKAVVNAFEQVAPLTQSWILPLGEEIKDPRSVQTWDLDSNRTYALFSGTDGKTKHQQVIMFNQENGQATWSTPAPMALDYCLPTLWNDVVACESKTSRKIVTIHPDGQIIGHDFAQWDYATGKHVLGGVLDKLLIVPLAISQGNSAGLELVYLLPDFTVRKQVQFLTKGATAAEPAHVQGHGAQTLSGVWTSSGTDLKVTWNYNLMVTGFRGQLDTNSLGDAPEVSLLEAGFFASSNPTADFPGTPGMAKWVIFSSDGKQSATGSSSLAVVQALHDQLRQGRYVDATSAQTLLSANTVPVIMNDRSIVTTNDLTTCVSWTSCQASTWRSEVGGTIYLKTPGLPLISSDQVIMFSEANGLSAYAKKDGKKLWSGILPPLEGNVGDPLELGSRILVLVQRGSIDSGNAKAEAVAWNLP